MAKEKKLGIGHFENKQLKPYQGQYPIYLRITYDRANLQFKSPSYQFAAYLNIIEHTDKNQLLLNDQRMITLIRILLDRDNVNYNVKTFNSGEYISLYETIHTVYFSRMKSRINKFLKSQKLIHTLDNLDLYDRDHFDYSSSLPEYDNFLSMLNELRPDLYTEYKLLQNEDDKMLDLMTKFEKKQNIFYLSSADILMNKELELMINKQGFGPVLDSWRKIVDPQNNSRIKIKLK